MYGDLNLPFKIEELKDNGEFTGWASIYGNIDQHGTVVDAGAFDDVVFNMIEDGLFPAITFEHKDIVGEQELFLEEKGLLVKGKIWIDSDLGLRVYKLMKSSRYGMSFRATPADTYYDDKGVLHGAKFCILSDTTITNNPSNKSAEILFIRDGKEAETEEKDKVSLIRAFQEATEKAFKEGIEKGKEELRKELSEIEKQKQEEAKEEKQVEEKPKEEEPENENKQTDESTVDESEKINDEKYIDEEMEKQFSEKINEWLGELKAKNQTENK